MVASFSALLYNPVYSALGVRANLTPDGTNVPVAIQAIDKTEGVPVGGSVDVQSVVPVATVRMAELIAKGVNMDDVDESLLELNGLVWRVRSHLHKPSPRGQADGEVYLLLSGEPETIQLSDFQQLLNTVKSSTVGGKLVGLWVFAQETQESALRNQLNPGTFDLVATNGPTFAVNRGFTGDGVSMHLLGPAFTLLAQAGFSVNNMSSGVFSISEDRSASLAIAGTDTAFQPFGFLAADTSRSAGMRAGTTTTDLLPAANRGIGHVSFSRSSSGSYSGYIDRMKTTIQTSSSSIPGTPRLTYLRAATNYSTAQLAVGWIGAALTDAEYVALDDAITTYLRRVGAYTQTRGMDGIWTWFNDPRVILVSSTPVVGGITSNGSAVVGRENTTTGLIERAVLRNTLLTDDHCNPALWLRAIDSRIIAGYNRHNDAVFYTRISSAANDVTSFKTEVDIAAQLAVGGGTNNFSYANFVELPGDTASGAATNKTFNSNGIIGGKWTLDGVAVTASQADLFGGTNASLVTASGALAQHRFISLDNEAFISGQPYASSVYVKPGTQRYVQITFPASAFGSTKYATYDLTGLVVVSGSTQNCTAYMYPVGGGWYRLVVVATATISATGNSMVFCWTDGSNVRSPATTASGTVTAIGAQVEQGSSATPLIVTTSAAVSRPATTNRLWLFFRATTGTVWTLHYSTSIDGGDTTWTPATRLLWPGRPYWKVKANGSGRIDFICNDQNPGDTTYAYCNTYHFYYRNGAFFKSDGTSAGSLPLVQSAPTKIYDGQATGFYSWVWDLKIFAGNPVACFAVFLSSMDHRYYQARWNGLAWTHKEVCAGGGRIYMAQPQYSGGIAQDPDDINVVYCSRQVDSGGNAVGMDGTFQLFKYITADGGVTWTGTQLTSGSVHCLRPYVTEGIRRLYYSRGSYTTYNLYDTTIEYLVL